ERQEPLAGKLAPEAVEDAGHLEGGAVADALAEDLRRVRGRSGHRELPAGVTAARDHGGLRIAVTVLETERDVRGVRRLDQRPPCHGRRAAGRFLVADQ